MSLAQAWLRSPRDHAVTAIVEGVFAAFWFSWVTQKPGAALNHVLVAGSIVALFAAIVGGILLFRFRSYPAVSKDASIRQQYSIIVGIEFGLIILGSLALGAAHQVGYIPVWVSLIVGVHFFSLAPVLHDRSLYPLGGLLCGVSAIALAAGLFAHSNPSAITATGVGCALTLFALYNVATTLTKKR